MRTWMVVLAGLILVLDACSRAATRPPASTATGVSATVETEPVPHRGDAADDPAIWLHPTDPAQSTIIVTDKLGGLAVYDLAGKQLQYLPDGKLNNVDLRGGFPLAGTTVTLVTAGNRGDNSIALYRVDPATRLLDDVAAGALTTQMTYGSCMYHSPATGRYFYIGTTPQGAVEQWELFDDGSGKVDGQRVRSFDVGSQAEGCVVDDELQQLYISEEDVGIWKYGAEPEAGTSRTLVDGTGPHLVPDIEGLAIAYGPNRTGLLIASSQGSSTYALYRRDGANAYLGSFRIVDGDGVDGTTETDGIDVTTANLGDAFPSGVFVAQDGDNTGGNQNVKLVPWQAIPARQ